MYLEVLNDKEKELFLSLAYNLSAVDKDFSPEERTIVSSYCHEMGISLDMDKIDLSVDKVIIIICIAYRKTHSLKNDYSLCLHRTDIVDIADDLINR